MDILAATDSDFDVVPFTKDNSFHPPNSEYFRRSGGSGGEGEYEGLLMPVLSNPSNPTGHTRSGAELEVTVCHLVSRCLPPLPLCSRPF